MVKKRHQIYIYFLKDNFISFIEIPFVTNNGPDNVRGPIISAGRLQDQFTWWKLHGQMSLLYIWYQEIWCQLGSVLVCPLHLVDQWQAIWCHFNFWKPSCASPCWSVTNNIMALQFSENLLVLQSSEDVLQLKLQVVQDYQHSPCYNICHQFDIPSIM